MKDAFLRFTRFFWHQTEVPFREVFHDPDAQYPRIVWLLRAFYAWVVYYVVTKGMRPRYFEPPDFDPMWPVIWIHLVPWDVGATLVVGLCIGGAVLALLFPRRPLPRILAFVGLFEFLGLWYSYTGVQHRTYTMLMLALFFALIPRLPATGASDDEKKRALLAVFGGLAFVLFTYSWAGGTKIYGIVEALLRGDAHLLDFGRVPVVFLNRAYRFENPPPMIEYVLDHPALASLGLFAVVYVEFVSMAAAFRPHLQRWWMLMLAVFHVGTLLTMKVFFLPATVVLVVLALFTPFGRPLRHWRPVLREIPWFGPLIAAGLNKAETLAGAPGHTTLYVPEHGGLARSLLRSLGDPLPDHLVIRSQGHSDFAALCSQHPYLFAERDALVSVHVRGDDRSLRLRSEALLHALSGLSGPRGWLFPAMLVPLPLYDYAYRRAARRAAAPADVAESTPGLAS